MGPNGRCFARGSPEGRNKVEITTLYRYRKGGHVTEWLVSARFRDLDGVAYAREFLEALDSGALERVAIRDRDGDAGGREPGFWGYCYPPTKTIAGYRVSVFARGRDHHFPLGTELWRREQKPGFRPRAFATHAGVLNPSTWCAV